MKLYIAGDLEVEAIREYMDKVASIVERLGVQTFVPHRDVPIPEQSGDEMGLLKEDDFDRFGQYVFEQDLNAIRECDGAIIILDGLCWGTTFEMGYAYAHRRFFNPEFKIIGVHTKGKTLDLMRRFSCDYILSSVEELHALLSKNI